MAIEPSPAMHDLLKMALSNDADDGGDGNDGNKESGMKSDGNSTPVTSVRA